jgi:hypothetical protein
VAQEVEELGASSFVDVEVLGQEVEAQDVLLVAVAEVEPFFVAQTF